MMDTLPDAVRVSLTFPGRAGAQGRHGSSLRAVVEFRVQGGDAMRDVGEVSVRAVSPDGAISFLTCYQLAPGRYAIDAPCRIPGRWWLVARCGLPTPAVAAIPYRALRLPGTVAA